MPKDTNSSEYQILKTEIRAILISAQQGCTERELVKDYAAYNSNSEIPYRALGYSSLMELLSSMPDVARINNSRAPPIIMGVADENTIHIQELVTRQKKNRKSVQRRDQYSSRAYSSTQYRQQPTSRSFYGTSQYTVVNPVAFNQNWAYVVPQQPVQFQPLPADQYILPSQRVNNPVRLPVDKPVASFPPKSVASSDLQTSRLTPNQDDASSTTTDEDTKQLEDEPWLGYDYKHAETYGVEIIFLRQRIRQLLVKFSNGFWLTSLEKLYKKMFNEDFKLEDFHLKNLLTFFDCISDFVDSKRVKGDEQNRLITLKTNLFDLVKKEQPDPDLATFLSKRNLNNDQQMFGEPEDSESMSMTDNRSIFVSANFRYKRAEFRMTGHFKCILGVFENPLNLTIAPFQFESARRVLMESLQDHYTQTHDDMSYVVTFEQLKLNLPCVYYHFDRQYYRGFIERIDQTTLNKSRTLRIRLVDYGASIGDINYYSESTFLKYLHQDFATQATEMYDCRLANLDLSPDNYQWSPKAKEMIDEFCKSQELFAEMTGILDSIYCVYLWSDDQSQQSINQILIQNGLAIESKDNDYAEFQLLIRYNENSTDLSLNPTERQYIDPKFLADRPTHQIDYSVEEKSLKHFTISIDHAYYLVKQPFTKRPCLPCFELANLLKIKEEDLHRIEIVSTSDFFYSDAYRDVFEALYRLENAIDCPHLHRNNGEISVKLYDLLNVYEYLKNVEIDGDVLDAFRSEYENYSREGYWHEFETVYMRENNIDSFEKVLSDRRNLLNYRREQLLSSSVDPTDSLYTEQIQDVDRRLRDIHQIRHSKSAELSSSPVRSASAMQNKSSKTKLRETLLRLARPFDRHFGLDICFPHGPLDESRLTMDLDELDECFRDLHRITDNVLQFFRLERDTLHHDDRAFFDHIANILPELIDGENNLHRRIDVYNYCFNVIESCQPVIRGYIQRTDLIDSI